MNNNKKKMQNILSIYLDLKQSISIQTDGKVEKKTSKHFEYTFEFEMKAMHTFSKT